MVIFIKYKIYIGGRPRGKNLSKQDDLERIMLENSDDEDDGIILEENNSENRNFAAKIDHFKNAGVTNEYMERNYYCNTVKNIEQSKFWIDM